MNTVLIYAKENQKVSYLDFMLVCYKNVFLNKGTFRGARKLAANRPRVLLGFLTNKYILLPFDYNFLMEQYFICLKEKL